MAAVPFSLEKLISALRERSAVSSPSVDGAVPSFADAVELVVENEDWPTSFRQGLIQDIMDAVKRWETQKTYRCPGFLEWI